MADEGRNRQKKENVGIKKEEKNAKKERKKERKEKELPGEKVGRKVNVRKGNSKKGEREE